MRLRELELLHALINSCSVSSASRALHMSQPNASKMLKKLEHNFGFQLFERNNGRLYPTAEARLMFEPIERTAISLKSFDRLVEEIREMHTGRLSIGCMPVLSRSWLPEALSRFMMANPGVAVSFHTRSSKRLIEWVADRQIDLAVTLLPLDDPMAERTILSKFEFVAALPADHPLVAREQITAADLDGQDYISLGVLDHARELIDKALAAAGSVPNERAECSLTTVAVQFVEQGIGVALVDHFTARDFSSNKVVFRPFVPRITMDIWLLRPGMRPRSRIVDAFIATLQAKVAEEQRYTIPSSLQKQTRTGLGNRLSHNPQCP